MSTRILIDLPGGEKVFFGGTGKESGLADVGIAEKVAQVGSEKFKTALGSLSGLVAAMEQSLGDMPRLPDKVELEFGATLTSQCDLWIVSGEGEAELKVKLTWGKGD
jgi:hypothetical protein